jgi:ABC-type uncharacterized transport system fused permease/ATPase subunit
MCFYKGEKTEKKNVDNLLKNYFKVTNKYYLAHLLVIFWQQLQATVPMGFIYLVVGS